MNLMQKLSSDLNRLLGFNLSESSSNEEILEALATAEPRMTQSAFETQMGALTERLVALETAEAPSLQIDNDAIVTAVNEALAPKFSAIQDQIATAEATVATVKSEVGQALNEVKAGAIKQEAPSKGPSATDAPIKKGAVSLDLSSLSSKAQNPLGNIFIN